MADTVKLVSSDGEVFEVERGVAMMSVMVKNCMDDTADDENRIPIPNVDAVTLAKVGGRQGDFGAWRDMEKIILTCRDGSGSFHVLVVLFSCDWIGAGWNHLGD
mmetsp:Transcript_4671/g.9411  ORF Transcript_4671/g.9411 Transcript_4671/m.9411 type:complete len:104 (-) Transcript_4671:685-996(-)